MILSETPRIELLNMDCMEFMAECRDKQFSLALIDPPYGLGKRTVDGGGSNSQIKFMDDMRRSNWDDNKPEDGYFQQLFRISENQIIWGGNYFNLPPYRTFICWDKMTYIPTMSQVELAWTSFDSPARFVKINSTQLDRIHPTQKLVKLYEWLLTNYAKPGDTILDTHGGSFSSAIAAYRLRFDFTGIELDADYFNAAVKRFKEQTVQMQLFKPEPKPEPVQLSFGDKLCPNCNRHHSEAGEFCCTACEFGI